MLLARSRCIVACALLLAPLSARADEPARAQADALFEKAMELMDRGDHAAACTAFAESSRLDPASGTTFNLGRCQEHLGRTATAYKTFVDAESAAAREGNAERQRAAGAAREALEPRLGRLVVTVPAPSRAAGIRVVRDGAEVDPSEWAKPVVVDPGRHVIEASAPGRRAWRTEADVRDASTTAVTIPPLAPETAALPPPARAQAQPPATTETGRPVQRTVAWIVGGAGLAAIGVGGVMGGVAIAKDSDSRSRCDDSDPNRCTQEGKALRDDAFDAARVSTVATVAGAALLGAGVVLWLTAPSPGAARGSTGTSVAARASVGSLLVEGRW